MPDLGDYRWDGYSLAQKQDWLAQGQGRSAVDGGVDYLGRLAEEFGRSEENLRGALGELGVHWSGGAADAAHRSLREMLGRAGGLTADSAGGGAGLSRYGDSYARVARAVPSVGELAGPAGAADAQVDDLAAVSGLQGDLRADQLARQRADEQANAAFRDHERVTRDALGSFHPDPAPKPTLPAGEPGAPPPDRPGRQRPPGARSGLADADREGPAPAGLDGPRPARAATPPGAVRPSTPRSGAGPESTAHPGSGAGRDSGAVAGSGAVRGHGAEPGNGVPPTGSQARADVPVGPEPGGVARGAPGPSGTPPAGSVDPRPPAGVVPTAISEALNGTGSPDTGSPDTPGSPDTGSRPSSAFVPAAADHPEDPSGRGDGGHHDANSANPANPGGNLGNAAGALPLAPIPPSMSTGYRPAAARLGRLIDPEEGPFGRSAVPGDGTEPGGLIRSSSRLNHRSDPSPGPPDPVPGPPAPAAEGAALGRAGQGGGFDEQFESPADRDGVAPVLGLRHRPPARAPRD